LRNLQLLVPRPDEVRATARDLRLTSGMTDSMPGKRVQSLCSRGHTVCRNNTTYCVFCFADPAHAALFCERFKGEPFSPKDRGRRSGWFLWQKRDWRLAFLRDMIQRRGLRWSMKPPVTVPFTC